MKNAYGGTFNVQRSTSNVQIKIAAATSRFLKFNVGRWTLDVGRFPLL